MTRPKKTTPGANILAQLSVADAALLSEHYSSLALSMTRISEIYKKVVEHEGGLFTKKAIKDPNAPKKPFTPYILFCNDARDKIRDKFPKYTSQQVSRELGVAWKSLNEEDKSVYLTRHIRDNERYLRELEEYKAKSGATATLEAAELTSPTEIVPLIEQNDFGSDPEGSESSDENLNSGNHKSKNKGRVKFSASSESEDEYEIEDDGDTKLEPPVKSSKTNGQHRNGNSNKRRSAEELPSITPTPESTPPPPSRERSSSQKKKLKKRMK